VVGRVEGDDAVSRPAAQATEALVNPASNKIVRHGLALLESLGRNTERIEKLVGRLEEFTAALR
jgi:hypothetical protein